MTGIERCGRKMAKISDEIREFVRRSYADEYMDPRELLAIADRADREMVELPKDADGEYIHIGDMMERGNTRGHVIALMLSKYPKKWGGELHWGVQLEGEQAPTALDAFFHHHHEPTVEDVLREFAYGLGVPVADSYVAAAATKLRLVEGVDE